MDLWCIFNDFSEENDINMRVFVCFCELQEVGYQHGKTVFDVWSRSGVVEKMLRDRHQEEFYNTQCKNNVRMEKKHERIYDKKVIKQSSEQSNNRI